MSSSDHAPANDAVLNACISMPSAVGPLYIVSVTAPSPPCPLKVGVGSLVTLPLSGLVIVTGAAIAAPAGPTAIAASDTIAARKSHLPALLMGSSSQPCRAPLWCPSAKVMVPVPNRAPEGTESLRNPGICGQSVRGPSLSSGAVASLPPNAESLTRVSGNGGPELLGRISR